MQMQHRDSSLRSEKHNLGDIADIIAHVYCYGVKNHLSFLGEYFFI